MSDPDPLGDPLDEGAEAPKVNKRPKYVTERYTRVPMRVLERDYPFNAAARLWLAMWDASREGSHKFKLSAEIWQQAHLSRELKSRILRELEAIGEIGVERNGNRAPMVEFRNRLQ
jgi:hypothetical protein